MTNYGLGRKRRKDKRDERYPVRALLPKKVARTKRYWWDNGAWFDQGDTGTCVGHAWAHFAEDSPITHPSLVVDPYAIYTEACKLDSWSANDDGDLDFGTSVRAGAKALRARGMIQEFRWAFSVTDVVNTVLEMGPMVIGVDWFESMFSPVRRTDSAGISRLFLDVEPGSGLAGGHALIINGVNTEAKALRLKNSWGRSWGADGRVSLSFDDMEVLLDRDGEACIAAEVK
jgi:hypothetical protein